MKNLFKQAIKTVLLLTLLIGVTMTVSAENMKKLGSMNVHYIALGSTFLTPTIAKTYGIERSRYNGLVNISVLDGALKGNPAKTVIISGTARNNIGQSKTLDFKEVKEGNAIYYLAQIHYSNEETFHFNIKIDDGSGQKTLKFDQKFYVD
ncbi:MAG: hypothetical protein COB35_10335 [Gammaproteobacteria bacterium]|nr:MAG: hypothetical protein COB35_10335 [Gammaproteobacteria bacterium]